jgi:hypothetical protein
MTPAFTPMAPTRGCVVHCRSHHHLVEKVFWEREVDARMLGQSTLETIGQRGFDDPRVFSTVPLTWASSRESPAEPVPRSGVS